MKPIDLACILVAGGFAIAGHFFPDASEILYIIAGSLVGKGLPQPSAYLNRKEPPP